MSTSKRRSSCQILQPWQLTPPEPTGNIDAADRQHIANTYSGILTNSDIQVSSDIALSDSVIANSLYTRILTTNLFFVDSVIASTNIQSVSNAIFIVDAVLASGVISNSAVTELNLDDSVSWKFTVTSLNASSAITIGDEVVAKNPVQNLSVSNAILLTDEVRRVKSEQSLNSAITIVDSVLVGLGLTSGFVLTESINYALAKNLASQLLLTDSVLTEAILSRSLTITLELTDSVIAYIPAKLNKCGFTAIGLPEITTLVKQSTITLTYPYSSPTMTLVLRAPSFGNSESHEYSRIIRESRGGTQRLFRAAIWPKIKKLSYQIDYNKNQKVNDFISFLESSVGKEIGLLDYLDRQWRGIILLSDDFFSHSSRANRQLSFDFEGELV